VIQGSAELQAKLNKLIEKSKAEGEPVVAVGYTANYALYVHEDTEMKWKGFSRDPRERRIEMGGDPSKARPRPRKREPKGKFWDPQGRGSAKFLETPARRDQAVLGKIVATAVSQGKTLAQALLLAGLHLQRESMLMVPVDTGNLKNSAFTRMEKG
jgi:hypothetical protein